MHGMRSVAQSVENKIVEAAKQLFRLFRHRAEIGEIGRVAKTKSENGGRAVVRGDRDYFQAEEIEWTVDRVHFHAGQRTDGGSVVENIGELPAERSLGFRRGINWNRATL